MSKDSKESHGSLDKEKEKLDVSKKSGKAGEDLQIAKEQALKKLMANTGELKLDKIKP